MDEYKYKFTLQNETSVLAHFLTYVPSYIYWELGSIFEPPIWETTQVTKYWKWR